MKTLVGMLGLNEEKLNSLNSGIVKKSNDRLEKYWKVKVVRRMKQNGAIKR